MFAQAAVGFIETYFIAKLGIDALAGVTLVFPVLMLMQMMSAGAMGGRDLVRDRPRARRRSSSETVPSSGIGGSDFSQASNRALS